MTKFETYSAVCPEGMKKTIKIISEDGQAPYWNLHPGPLRYEGASSQPLDYNIWYTKLS